MLRSVHANYAYGCTQKLKWFLEECWEKKHHVFKANELKRKAFDGLFTCDSLDAVMKDREAEGGEGPLEFGVDLNAAKYVNGVRETPNGEVSRDAGHVAVHKRNWEIKYISKELDQLGAMFNMQALACKGFKFFFDLRWEMPRLYGHFSKRG